MPLGTGHEAAEEVHDLSDVDADDCEEDRDDDDHERARQTEALDVGRAHDQLAVALILKLLEDLVADFIFVLDVGVVGLEHWQAYRVVWLADVFGYAGLELGQFCLEPCRGLYVPLVIWQSRRLVVAVYMVAGKKR